jgi:hypothetical protein
MITAWPEPGERGKWIITHYFFTEAAHSECSRHGNFDGHTGIRVNVHLKLAQTTGSFSVSTNYSIYLTVSGVQWRLGDIVQVILTYETLQQGLYFAGECKVEAETQQEKGADLTSETGSILALSGCVAWGQPCTLPPEL